MADSQIPAKRPKRSCSLDRPCWLSTKDESKERRKEVKVILKKSEGERSASEIQILEQYPEVVEEIQKSAKRLDKVKKQQLEIEDPSDLLEEKIERLCRIMKNAEHLIVYTGAGISTAASIPDYRGPNGVWTLLQKGKQVKSTSIVDAVPTVTHMSLYKLFQENLIKHIVSQNCDGLHIRSGLPQSSLSEIHGNMFIEVCKNCKPECQYIRLFDVTEKTSLHRHLTGRRCHGCRNMLQDTIIHFGEKGNHKFPLNWESAKDHAEDADVILCLGSSLKVLKSYHCLWCMDRPQSKRPKLCIVNLQWTPKDSQAHLKINAKCNDVIVQVMKKLELQIPEYNRSCDPLFAMATQLRRKELNSFTTKILSKENDTFRQNYTNEKSNSTNEIKDPEVTAEEKKDGDETESSNPGWFGKGCRKRQTRGKRRRRSHIAKDEVT